MPMHPYEILVEQALPLSLFVKMAIPTNMDVQFNDQGGIDWGELRGKQIPIPSVSFSNTSSRSIRVGVTIQYSNEADGEPLWQVISPGTSAIFSLEGKFLTATYQVHFGGTDEAHSTVTIRVQPPKQG